MHFEAGECSGSSSFKFRGLSQPRLELVLPCFHLLALPFSSGRFVSTFHSVYNFHRTVGFSRQESSSHSSASLLLLFCTLWPSAFWVDAFRSQWFGLSLFLPLAQLVLVCCWISHSSRKGAAEGIFPLAWIVLIQSCAECGSASLEWDERVCLCSFLVGKKWFWWLTCLIPLKKNKQNNQTRKQELQQNWC